MKTITHFDVSRIIGIRICDKTKDSYGWLPKKQKTWFFGLFKRNAWYSEGFYPYACYKEEYECGSWDSTPATKEELIRIGYLVDSQNCVWNRPIVQVFLEGKHEIRQKFSTIEEASSWVEELKQISGKTFEIIRVE